jgi:heme/copper-type cytochrome/quinol oxidase subunit 2
VLSTLTSLVAEFRVPNATAPPGAEKITTAFSYFMWGVGVIGVLALILIGIMMMIKHNKHDGGGETGAKLGWWAIGAFLIAASGSLAGAMIG